MAKIDWSSDVNSSLIEKVRCGKSPTPKDRRIKLTYSGVTHSSEDTKLKIQNDILDSLKEKDGIPPLVYPQDYIFDIAHFRTNGNLGEFIDDMSNITNAEEKFEMVKSENKILRERLNNALQREMKAIKTFQKLANENRLLLLRLKEQGTKERSKYNDVNQDDSYAFMNGNSKYSLQNDNKNFIEKRSIKMANKSTSTCDMKKNAESKSTSTYDLEEMIAIETKSTQTKNHKRNQERLSQKRKALLKAVSSPNIFEDSNRVIDDVKQSRSRSASLGGGDNEQLITDDIADNTTNNTSILRKHSEKRVCSVPSNLDVVDEEGDAKENKVLYNSRSSISSEGTISRPRSASSGSNTSRPTSGTIELEKSDATTTESLRILHLYSRSLPSQLNKKHILPTSSIDNEELSEQEKKKSTTFSGLLKRRSTADSITIKRPASAGSTRSTSTNFEKKYDRKPGTSSDDSDKEENIPNARRRRGAQVENPTDFLAGIRKFQKMLSTGELSHPSHESDNEEDILQACEAVSNQRYNRRRGSAVVQIPTSSVQMDLHVSTDESLEDKKSRWASILKNKKKLILQKDKVRISEDLKEFLTNKTRSNRIDAETELLLYKDAHWTDFQNLVARKSSPTTSSANGLPSKERKRREAVWELFHSEVVYLTGHLLVLKECFMEPLLDIQSKGFLVSVDHFKIFSNLEELCEVSAKFAKDLLHLFKNEQENQFGSTAIVVTAFTKFKWSVHPQYERYCLGYANSLNYLEHLKQMHDMQVFLKWCESDPRCNRLKLTDLLVAPFQHLTKYPLLLKNIRKQTSEGDRQQVPLASTIKSVVVLIQQLESNVTVVKNYRKLKELQKNLVWPPVADLDPKSFIPDFLKSAVSRQECQGIIASPKRELLYEGSLTLYESAKVDVFVFLFDDMILLTKWTKRNTKHSRKFSGSAPPENVVTSPSTARKTADYTYTVIKQPIPIDRFILHDLDEFQANSFKHGFVLVHTSRFKQAIALYTLQAPSQDVKEMWIMKLRLAQNKWKETIEQEIESMEKNFSYFENRSESRESNDCENASDIEQGDDDDDDDDQSSNNSSLEDYDDTFSNDETESQHDM